MLNSGTNQKWKKIMCGLCYFDRKFFLICTAIYSMNLLKFALKRCYIFLNVYGASQVQEYTLLAWAIFQQVVQDCHKSLYELWLLFNSIARMLLRKGLLLSSFFRTLVQFYLKLLTDFTAGICWSLAFSLKNCTCRLQNKLVKLWLINCQLSLF